MRTSDRGVAFLVAHEGIVPAPYLDSVNVWTYGIGHTAAAGSPNPSNLKRGMPADLDAALRDVFAVFRRDLEKYENAVSAALAGMTVAQHEFDAAVSFHFNTGAIARADWVRKWRAGDKSGAGAAIMSWSKPAAIIPRRKAEQALWTGGTYGVSRASVWQATDAGRVVWKPVRTLTQAEIIAMLRGSSAAPAARPAASTGTGGLAAALASLFSALFPRR